jgi:type II secretion system (T2SS) protein E
MDLIDPPAERITLYEQLGLVTALDVYRAQLLRGCFGGSLAAWLVRTRAVDEHDLARALGMDAMWLDAEELSEIPDRVRALVPLHMALEHSVLPVALEGERTLVLAMVDPLDHHALAAVTFRARRRIVRAVAVESVIRAATERCYGIRMPDLTVIDPPREAMGA